MNVIFLDYDGVVNTPMWNEDGTRCRYNFPKDNKVNNFQAVQWVSEFCQKYGYSIVVSSTWRMDSNYKECLVNGGLRAGIEILGRTEICKDVKDSYTGIYVTRGVEIEQYLEQHPEVDEYLIFDDDDGLWEYQIEHLVLTDGTAGFTMNDFNKAVRLHRKFETGL
jgi:hypothetical protein